MEANTFRPGSASVTATTVEIAVSCRDLMDMDTFSKSDPMAVLFVKEFGTKDNWLEIGRTEVINNNLNPDFVKTFTMNYFFEERQMLKFEIYDVDAKSTDLKRHDFLGRLECALGEIVSEIRVTRPLTGPKVRKGTIISVTVEEQSKCKDEISMQFSAKNLDKKDWCTKSDPFLAFYKVNEDNSYTVVHRTDVIKNNLNPTWKPFTVQVRTLCSGDYNRSILIKCIDWNRDGSEDLIGKCSTNMNELATGSYSWKLPSEGKDGCCRRKKGMGNLSLMNSQIKRMFTFVDYIQAGTQLNCTIAIDFTASNGAPTDPNSLHFVDAYQPSQYARALTAVGEIIQDYDSDKLFPVLGFGAKLPPDGRISHEFFVNMSRDNPFCNGIQGVLQAYNQALLSVQLSGPTNFAPVINHVAKFAAANRDGSEYFILLILTDGVITDMPQTKDAIVNACTLPLSIIIVGIGNAEFDAMNELDADRVPLTSKGKTAVRDIVQFVPFRDFVKGNSSIDLMVSQARLAKEVLAEIPDQFLSYMKANKIIPGSWPGEGREEKVTRRRYLLVGAPVQCPLSVLAVSEMYPVSNCSQMYRILHRNIDFA